jgi:hypothetical protein
MKKLLLPAVLLATGMAVILPTLAVGDDEGERDSDDALTLAVYGDAPYGCKAQTSDHFPDECPNATGSITDPIPDSSGGLLPIPGDVRQISATPAFIDAVNRDRKVKLVLHTGDIHSGSTFCTQAYNQTVYNLWTQFRDPLVYTPGDNEWTDCQKAKEGGGAKYAAGPHAGEYVSYAAGHPVANLALVRSMFFPVAGETLGGRAKHVISQAEAYDPAHPSDAEYIENVMWRQAGVVFVTLNIPGGSNNDNDQWNPGAFGALRTAPQIQEVANRTGAGKRWLEAAFAMAKSSRAKGVVIMEQADMWDLDGTALATGHILGYKPFIDNIAALTADFAKPVLLMNGDSHKYRSDNPLVDNSACEVETGAGTATTACSDDAYDSQPATAAVSNFHRLVVHGSTFPLQYTRLTVNPEANHATTATSFGPFSWERVIP